MEKHHFKEVSQLYMAILNGYIKLPEGIRNSTIPVIKPDWD
jgi:hypothetical protein